MFRLRSPPTPLEEQMNYAPDQRDMDRLIEQLHSNETWPSTNWTPHPPTLTKEESHPKLYLAKMEERNLGNNFGYKQEISEIISEQLKKKARPEKKIKIRYRKQSQWIYWLCGINPLNRKSILRPFKTCRAIFIQEKESISFQQHSRKPWYLILIRKL